MRFFLLFGKSSMLTGAKGWFPGGVAMTESGFAAGGVPSSVGESLRSSSLVNRLSLRRR
jgi:hypothetical protein